MTWTTATLAELIADLRSRRGDTTAIEVKSAAGGCPQVGATLCAFGNMPDGGTLILGLDESSGFVPSGLAELGALEQAVAAQARQAVDPPVACTFTSLDIDGQKVLICDVAGLPLTARPARHRGQAYLRQADGDYPMSDQEITQIELLKIQSTHPTHPDREPIPGTSTADLDSGLTESFLAAARTASRRHASVSDDELLRRTGVVTAGGELSLAGLYALGNYPQQFRPSLSITAAVQLPRGSGDRNRDLQHFDGPLPALLDDAMEWVRRNTRPIMGYDDRGHGVDRTELPMVAVREIIANALVHRSLEPIADSKRVEIRLLDDQLVITSPGGLWGVSEAQLGKPNGKSAVNLSLYDICRRARMSDGSRVIEGEGGGIREALLALREAGLRPPTFIDYGVRFTALISRHTLLNGEEISWLSSLPGSSVLSSEQRAILASMRRGIVWTNGKVREDFAPMDSVVARRLLQHLVDLGFAVMTGPRSTAIYELAPTWGGQPTDAAIHRLGPNALTVWRALQRRGTFQELRQRMTLSDKQIRYALDKLRAADVVILDGAAGLRDSTYRRKVLE